MKSFHIVDIILSLTDKVVLQHYELACLKTPTADIPK